MTLFDKSKKHSSTEKAKETIVIPKFISRSGSLIYSEPDNPYETVEVYIDTYEYFVIKQYIFDRGNGAGGWRALFLDEENEKKLRDLTNGQPAESLRDHFKDGGSMYSLMKKLDEAGLEYVPGYYT